MGVCVVCKGEILEDRQGKTCQNICEAIDATAASIINSDRISLGAKPLTDKEMLGWLQTQCKGFSTTLLDWPLALKYLKDRVEELKKGSK